MKTEKISWRKGSWQPNWHQAISLKEMIIENWTLKSAK